MSFTHLHTHSHYSLLEALPQIKPLVKKAKSLDMKHLALTDTNNLYGAIEFQGECEKNEIHPIFGVEISVCEKSVNDPIDSTNRIFKMVVLCKDNIGYKNLLKLISETHTVPKEKMYSCTDIKTIEKYHEGLILLSGLTESYLWEKLRSDDFEAAKTHLNNYKNIFGDDFYVEIGNLPQIEDGQKVHENTIKIAKELSLPLVATYNVHYLEATDRNAQKTLMGISNDADAKPRHKRLFEKGYYNFTSFDDAKKHFAHVPEAIENTEKIAEKCQTKIELGKWVFPKIEIPDGKNADDYLREITYKGFELRAVEKTPEVLKRVDYELDVIKMKGYAPYFLVVSDLLRFARENGILSNIRGSVSGSMVTFLSGITNIDPLVFEIPFERFLNPERPSAPDIDMDYADNRREDMINYVKQKYGEERIAQIGTFGTMAARAAVRDTARSLGYPYLVGDKISKLVPPGSQGFPMTLDRAIEEDPDFKKEYEGNRETKDIVDLARKIEGNARHIGIHAAGVVISPTTLEDFTAIQFDPKGEKKIITQYDMYSIEDAGLLKFDFLGLGNLRIIKECIDLIKFHQGKDVDYERLPMDDKLTFEKLGKGETVDTFQLNGTGMTKFLMDLEPTTIHDINAMVALYRPGPLQFIPEYIKRKHKPELISYLDPALEPILKKTNGILVYQDDLLMMAHLLAGYSWGEVDKFRKAVGKKIPEEMAAQKEKFIKGCVEYSKWEKKKAEELWAWIEPFAAYGFNKAHSVSYGRVAYVTAYLKANFPTEYMTAVLNSEEGEVEKIAISIKECKRLGIIVKPPNINVSGEHFSIIKGKAKEDGTKEADTIVFGLTTVKNLGSDAVKEIVKERTENGLFKTFPDFLKRIPGRSLNKKSIEALCKSGSLDDIETRDKLLFNIENILAYQHQIHNTHKHEVSLFDDAEDFEILTLKDAPEIERNQKLLWERELTGLYLTGHPLDPWKEVLSKRDVTIHKINTEIKENTSVVFAGVIGTVRTMLTKNKDKMAFLEAQDLESSIEVVVFPKTYAQYKDLIIGDTPLAFRGKVSLKNKREEENTDQLEEEKNKYGAKSIILEEIRRI